MWDSLARILFLVKYLFEKYCAAFLNLAPAEGKHMQRRWKKMHNEKYDLNIHPCGVHALLLKRGPEIIEF